MLERSESQTFQFLKNQPLIDVFLGNFPNIFKAAISRIASAYLFFSSFAGIQKKYTEMEQKTEAYSELSQTSKMKVSLKIVLGLKAIQYFHKICLLKTLLSSACF